MAFTYNPYQKGQRLLDLEEEQKRLLGSKPAAWDREKNYAPVQLALDAYKNRGKFSYDINTDALYNQYKDQYVNQGKQAMMDVMGQALAMTGGYGNSYAQTVGQQTYQGYLQGLNDKVPELYQLALEKYNQEGADLLNAVGLEKDKYDAGYGEWKDAMSLWDADRDYITAAVQNEQAYDYGRYSDGYNRALAEFNSDQDERVAGLEAKISGMIDPDKVQTNENGEITGIDGQQVAQTTGAVSYGAQTVTGFKPRKGDNFKINGHTVENKGEVTDETLKSKLDAASKNDGDLINRNGELYYRNGGKYYKVGATNGLFGIGETKGYKNLMDSLYKD